MNNIRPEDNPRRITDQDEGDIRTMAQAGRDWPAIQRFVNRPMDEVQREVWTRWPSTAALLDRNTSG